MSLNGGNRYVVITVFDVI